MGWEICVEAVVEPLILEPEDWNEGEWNTIKKLFGFKKNDNVERIEVKISEIDYFIEKIY